MEVSLANVVVTGGAGFIGSHVVDRLVSGGSHVTVLDDLSVGSPDNLTEAQERGAVLEVGDVRDADLVRKVVDGADTVIHMACSNLRASLGDPIGSHEVNATGALVAALAARDAGVGRFVHVSSSEAYGTALTRPMAEDHPLEPTTVYGAAKAAGELYARGVMRAYGLPVVVVRPFNSYGPREHATGTSGEVIPRFVRRILAGRPPIVFGDGTQTRDFTWVEETAEGIVAAAASPATTGCTLNVASGREVSVLELATTLLDLMGAQELGVEHQPGRPGDVDQHWADTHRAEDLVGFRARVGIREGLARYVEWVAAHRDEESSHPDDRNW